MTKPRSEGAGDSDPSRPSKMAALMADIIVSLRRGKSPLGVMLSETYTAGRLGEVMSAIIGGDDTTSRYIKEGYQYTGDNGARLWRAATVDEDYRTISWGIHQFHEHWHAIEARLTGPYHYVSIGPGTGEKDQTILQHLQQQAGEQTIVYVPVDISRALLRIGVDVALRGVNRERVEVLPVELDITNEDALSALRLVLQRLSLDAGLLISLLGNTLANFRDDRQMLTNISHLLGSDRDLLFLELATATDATKSLAAQAAREYDNSKSFRQFCMASLFEYTDLNERKGKVECVGELGAKDVLRITTRFRAHKRTRVRVQTGEDFTLDAHESIELLLSRKYTQPAIDRFLDGLTQVEAETTKFADGFGIAMYLLARQPRRRRK
jgi:L-histidine Nalpha-methyltransferase